MSATSTLPTRLAALVAAHPDKPLLQFFDARAIEAEPHTVSYGALWVNAARIAGAFDDLAPGDVLLLVMPLSPELFETHVAGMIRGCVVSIYTTPSEKIARDVYRANLSHALTKIRPAAVVTVEALADSITPVAAAAGCRCIVVHGGPEHSPEPFALSALPDDRTRPVILQHSSGSTGLQKGVQLDHRKVILQCESYGRFIGFDGATDIICSWLPMYHDMGLFCSWLMPLVLGGTVKLLDPFAWVQNPSSLLRLADRERGTLIWQPNFAFNLLADRVSGDEAGTFDLSSVRGFTNCSEPVHQAVMDKFRRRFELAGVTWDSLWACYAMAENAFAVTATRPSELHDAPVEIDAEAFAEGRIETPAAGRAGRVIASCGSTVEGCELRIVDSSRRVLGDRCIGEIAITSDFLFDQYLHNPVATQAAIDGDGWYYTGDLGFTVDGRLYVTGRKKDLIIIGGRNFYPQDIESICNEIEGVLPGRCVALGVSQETLGTEGVLVIVEVRQQDLGRADDISAAVRREVFERLDCVVNDVFVVPHMWLLKTSSGKIARQPNLARFISERTAAREAARRARAIAEAPQAGARAALGWGAVLGVACSLYLVFSVWSTSESWVVYAGF